MTTSADIASRGSRPWLIGVLVGVAGLAASTYVARSLQREEDLRIASQFATSAQGWREAIQRESDLFLEVLESLRHLHTLSSSVSREAFAEFEAKGLAFARAELGGFGFAQHVFRASRAAFEAVTPPQEGGLAIVEPGPDGLQPAAEREDWYPIVHSEPAELAPRGFDLASDPRQRERIAAAIQNGTAVVGAPFLSTDTLVLTPIVELRYDAARRAYAVETRGLAFAWLQPQRLLARALPGQAAAFVRAELRPPGMESVMAAAGEEPDYEGDVRVADQRWRFRARAVDGYLPRQRSGHAGALRVAGAALALLAGALAWGAAGYTEHVRRLVKLRTADLEHEREERARLEHELLEAGRKERQRVGQDLHDSLGQKLAGAAMLARAAAQAPPDESRAQMHQVAEVVKDSLTQVRRIARGLAPMDLDDAALGDALRRLSDETCDLLGVACSAETQPGLHPRGAGTALHLYQIAQEAISNAVRHGAATEIRITLSRADNTGELVIRDNGRGLPPDAHTRGGLGLRLMHHRAALFGGKLTATAGETGGTVVRCEFPLAAS